MAPDPRMKFVRSKENPFLGLDDYRNAPEIEVQNKEITYPLQLSLFPDTRSNYGLRVRLGHFYELLSQGINGGKVKERQEMSNGTLIGTLVSEPDVSSKNYYREAKGIRPGGDLKLIDNQIAKYFLLQTGKFATKRNISF